MNKIQQIITIIVLFNTLSFSQSSTEEIKKQIVNVIGHAHMDPVYRWRWNEIRDREISNTFVDVLKTLDKYPELHFAQSSMLYYYETQKNYPKLFEEIKHSIRDKRWSVVGGQWVECDEIMPSGESLIRQFLIANDYYSKNLEIDNIDIAWAPDIFTGHPITLPKIYAGCGIKNYVFSRSAPDGKRIFWWESKDGTKILGYKIPGHYNPDYKKLPNVIKEWTKIAKFNLPLLTFGKGDHGGGPDEEDIENFKKIERNFPLKFEPTSPEIYFNNLRKSEVQWPIEQNEFGVSVTKNRWKGCYTSQAEIKKNNRFYENQLIVAEKFSVIGIMHKGKPFYPREDFKDAWRILLFNQFHDILPGTLAGLGVNDVYKDYERLDNIVTEQLDAGLENIGNRINTQIKGIPIVVYNPHSWLVNQMIEAEVNFIKKPSEITLKDNKGKSVPFSIISNSKDSLSFWLNIYAKNIPAFGYKVFEVVEQKAEKAESDIEIKNNSIENNYYKIKWNEKGITSLFSKKLQKEILQSTANKLQLLEDFGNSWNLRLTGKKFEIKNITAPEIVFKSPIKVVVKWANYFQATKITSFMTLNTNSEQIDFEMKVDWHSSDKLLRVVFPTNIKNGEAYYNQPYGYVKREESDLDVPVQKWIDYSNSNYGVSLLNDGKYGFSINNGVLTMSVLRSARDMDPRMDEGVNSFKYALIIHKGNWRDADIPLRAWELNQPLVVKQENRHRGKIQAWKYKEQSFPLENSFFSINSDHVIISTLKTKQDAYEPNPIILRIVETEGRNEDVIVYLPYNAISVKECNHLEEEIESRSEIKLGEEQFSFKMGHDQIRTFMIEFK